MNPQQQRKSKPLSDEGKDMYFSDLRISRVGVYIFFSFLLVWIETLLNICHSACCPRNKGKQCKDKSNTSMIDFPFVGCVVIFLRTKYFLNDDTSSLKYMIRHCFEIFVYLVESPQVVSIKNSEEQHPLQTLVKQCMCLNSTLTLYLSLWVSPCSKE